MFYRNKSISDVYLSNIKIMNYTTEFDSLDVSRTEITLYNAA